MNFAFLLAAGVAFQGSYPVLLKKTLPDQRLLVAERLPVTTNEFLAEWNGNISLKQLTNCSWIRISLLAPSGEKSVLWQFMDWQKLVLEFRPEPNVIEGTGWRILDLDYDEANGHLLLLRRKAIITSVQAVKCPPFPGREFALAVDPVVLAQMRMDSGRILREGSQLRIVLELKGTPTLVFELQRQRWIQVGGENRPEANLPTGKSPPRN
jgi:hypothetical protein